MAFIEGVGTSIFLKNVVYDTGKGGGGGWSFLYFRVNKANMSAKPTAYIGQLVYPGSRWWGHLSNKDGFYEYSAGFWRPLGTAIRIPNNGWEFCAQYTLCG